MGCQGHDKGCSYEGNCNRTRPETEGLLRGAQQFRVHRHERSEEVRGVHYPRHLPYQDPHKTSHEGRCENGFWPGDQGEGEASKDNCEGLPSGRTEEADLASTLWLCYLSAFPEV